LRGHRPMAAKILLAVRRGCPGFRSAHARVPLRRRRWTAPIFPSPSHVSRHFCSRPSGGSASDQVSGLLGDQSRFTQTADNPAPRSHVRRVRTRHERRPPRPVLANAVGPSPVQLRPHPSPTLRSRVGSNPPRPHLQKPSRNASGVRTHVLPTCTRTPAAMHHVVISTCCAAVIRTDDLLNPADLPCNQRDRSCLPARGDLACDPLHSVVLFPAAVSCPEGASANSDDDCAAICGNRVVARRRAARRRQPSRPPRRRAPLADQRARDRQELLARTRECGVWECGYELRE
jgi:hypothetical protein